MARDPLERPERLIRMVYAYVAYRIGPGPDAEDITSEVFERAVRYRSTYHQIRGEPLPWLIGIARHCLVDATTSNPHPPLTQLDDESAAPGDLAEDTLRRLSLVDAVAHLSERDRELIALRYGAGLSGREIGVLMEISANAVDVAVHRAVERLRNALDDTAR